MWIKDDQIRLVLAEIFHYSGTGTNVSRTNVALSNVLNTIANLYRWANQQTLEVWLRSDQ